MVERNGLTACAFSIKNDASSINNKTLIVSQPTHSSGGSHSDRGLFSSINARGADFGLARVDINGLTACASSFNNETLVV
jgi:hypothetical protein